MTKSNFYSSEPLLKQFRETLKPYFVWSIKLSMGCSWNLLHAHQLNCSTLSKDSGFIPLVWTSTAGVEYHLIFLILIFNLSVFELVGFQTKLFKDLWYIYFHAVKVFSMFFLSSLDLCSAYCAFLRSQMYLKLFKSGIFMSLKEF